MESKNARIFVASVKNVTNRLEHYGDANISNISLLKLIYKYACYSTEYATLQRLDKMVSHLQKVDKDICLERQVSTGSDYIAPVGIVEVGVGVNENQPPVLTDSSVTVVDGAEIYTFSYSDLFSGYSDPDGDLMGAFVIKSLPANGELKYNGEAAVVETLYGNPSLLEYGKDSDGAYSTTFTYTAFDNDPQLRLESNTATCTVNVEAVVISNEPPVIGDRAQYAGNRVTTVFTVADFTTHTIAPYFDPEANDLDAIRIDEISDANTGVYYYFGNPVVAGQVITAAELANGAFYHVAPDANGISTDSFNASVRDTGSMIWVQ